jgi:hypothetical protein
VSTIGIALCTFEGARFVDEQLDSLCAQSRRPDLVVIADDGSKDGTLDRVASFARRAPFEVRVLEPEASPLGPTRNFERAARLLTTELVAFCDQDDRWHADKLERQAAALDRDPGATLVLCNARLVDGEGRSIGRELWSTLGFRCPPSRDLSALVDAWLVRRTLAFGFTMLFRRSVLEVALPVGEGWGHDNWTAMVAAGLGRVCLIPEPMADYRQHGAQVSSATPVHQSAFLAPARHGLWATPASYDALADRLAEAWGDPTLVRALQRKGAHLRARAAIGTGPLRGLDRLAREVVTGGYGRYSNGLRSVAVDAYRALVARRNPGQSPACM